MTQQFVSLDLLIGSTLLYAAVLCFVIVRAHLESKRHKAEISMLRGMLRNAPLTRDQRFRVARELERQRRKHENHVLMRRGTFSARAPGAGKKKA